MFQDTWVDANFMRDVSEVADQKQKTILLSAKQTTAPPAKCWLTVGELLANSRLTIACKRSQLVGELSADCRVLVGKSFQ